MRSLLLFFTTEIPTQIEESKEKILPIIKAVDMIDSLKGLCFKMGYLL